MHVICAWCKADMGEKEGEGVSHGICQECYDKEITKLKPEDSLLQAIYNNKE